MSCLNPSVAVSLYKDKELKHHLKFIAPSHHDFSITRLKARYGEDNVFLLPCGKCDECKKEYARQWAVRCSCEAQFHKFNYFITLTYNNDNVRYACYDDLKKFLDRLEGRNHNNKFKYFACFEYGELTNRPHWHLALFSDFDLKLYDPTLLNGFIYYHSKILDKKWTFGLHNVAIFKNNCAGYIAKYTSKNGKLFMSRNIGKVYYDNFKDEIVKNDFKLYGNFGCSYVVNIPDSFARWFLNDKDFRFILAKDDKLLLNKVLIKSKIRNSGMSLEDQFILSERTRIKDKCRKGVRL